MMWRMMGGVGSVRGLMEMTKGLHCVVRSQGRDSGRLKAAAYFQWPTLGFHSTDSEVTELRNPASV